MRVPWEAADRWLEEDEEIIVHPHDPYHRIEVLRSSRLVRVLVDGEPVAETSRPRILFETGLPPGTTWREMTSAWSRWSRSTSRPGAREERLGDVLGRRYDQWARAGGRLELPEPLREGELVQLDLLCFFQERSEIAVEVDGVVAETPPTPWSGTGWLEAEGHVGRTRLNAAIARSRWPA